VLWPADSAPLLRQVADDDTVIIRDESGTTTKHGSYSPSKGSKNKLEEDEAAEAARFYTYACLCFAAIAVMLYHAPPAPSGAKCENVSLPWLVKGVASGNMLPTLVEAWGCAEAYNRAHPEYTLGIIASVYIGLQTFAIPGKPNHANPDRRTVAVVCLTWPLTHSGVLFLPPSVLTVLRSYRSLYRGGRAVWVLGRSAPECSLRWGWSLGLLYALQDNGKVRE